MISGGEACGAGGGVFNAGDLTLTASIVQDSLAERGGGIANTGTLRTSCGLKPASAAAYPRVSPAPHGEQPT